MTHPQKDLVCFRCAVLVSYILRWFNNIVKIFAAAAHVPCEVVIAHYTIHTPMGPWTLLACAGILASVLLYKLNPHPSQDSAKDRAAVLYKKDDDPSKAPPDIDEDAVNLLSHEFKV